MKTRINLFRRKPQQDYISVHASQIKRTLTTAGVVLFLLFIFLITQVLRLDSQQQELLKKKETYLKYLMDEKEAEVNVRYFKSKQTQMNAFLKNDANFLPYYSVLKKSLDEGVAKPILDTIDIDKDRKTTFIVRFSSYAEMDLFLKYIESEDFLKNFSSLSLQSFSINKQTVTGNRFELELKGVFKELK